MVSWDVGLRHTCSETQDKIRPLILTLEAMVGSDDERRRKPRYDCSLHVITETPGSEPIHGQASNLSATGLRMDMEEPVEVGTAVRHHLRLVLGWTEANFLTLPAVVRWCESGPDGYQVGTEFSGEMAEEHGKRLKLLVRVLSGELDLGMGPLDSSDGK